MALEESGNKTIYALRQDQQLQYHLLPIASPMKMDGDEVPLGNRNSSFPGLGHSMQADGTILTESTESPEAVTPRPLEALEAEAEEATTTHPTTATIANTITPTSSSSSPVTATQLPPPPTSSLLHFPEAEDESGKQKSSSRSAIMQHTRSRDTNVRNGKSGGGGGGGSSSGTPRTSSVKKSAGKSIQFGRSIVSPCPSHPARMMLSGNNSLLSSSSHSFRNSGLDSGTAS